MSRVLLVFEAKVTRLARDYRMRSAASPGSPEAMATYRELGSTVRMMRAARARGAR